jgi:hypothetical protein
MICLANKVARDLSCRKRPSDATIRAFRWLAEQIRGLPGCLLRLCGPGIAPLHITEV